MLLLWLAQNRMVFYILCRRHCIFKCRQDFRHLYLTIWQSVYSKIVRLYSWGWIVIRSLKINLKKRNYMVFEVIFFFIIYDVKGTCRITLLKLTIIFYSKLAIFNLGKRYEWFIIVETWRLNLFRIVYSLLWWVM